MHWLRRWAEPALVVVTVGALLAGGVGWLLDAGRFADVCWAAGTIVAAVPAAWWVVAALRQKRAGVDLIAVLALGGTLVVHEYLAGALIAVMLATGRALDAAAERRASHDLRALLEHAPRSARRRRGDTVSVVPLSEVTVGDVLVVGPGEVVPADGLLEGAAVLDESVLTGEPMQVERAEGDPVRSGVVNAGSAFELWATATAEDSTYAGIVRLAREAGAESAPVVRLADRYAAWFLPLSLVLAGLAWVFSGSLVRAVAVLVVATPCPLLLAAPVAIVSGLSRSSRLGVIIRGGGALETLGRARTLVLDKTGTLTAGRPVVVEIAAAPGWEAAEVLRLAASAEQLSPHVLAEAITAEARARGLSLSLPRDVVEEPGRGVTATVDGRRVEVGKPAQPADQAWATAVRGRAGLDGAALAWLTVDGELTGAVLLRDPLRRDAPRTLRRLRAAELRRLVMLTGDRREPAEEIGTVLGLDAVRADQTPADKVAAVRGERERDVTVMVGDGVNDAPALAAADVGVAMGARGSTASSEAADVVLTTDRLDRLADAMDIARRSRRIAVQSAVTGMVLSLAAMAVAAVGWLPPAAGALLQEGIDVAVILNALRALRGRPAGGIALAPATEQLLHRFAAEHDELRGSLPMVRDAANLLAESGATPDALAELERVHSFLVERLLPHERAEETQLYPALATPLGSDEATATMSRAHAEIERLTRRLTHHLRLAEAGGRIDPAQVDDLLSGLYGLYSVLSLHFVQEEENYFALASDTEPTGARS
ncbi:heavy metal translocating P-type ATPase [Amycolatopsis sp. NPDC021455]|uniref:heavy metal translocating P-type ATPase n=1 Tax=Amycolatopsis sp. NPDC021455 TaxID=3154901 RepID=UPI00340E26C9